MASASILKPLHKETWLNNKPAIDWFRIFFFCICLGAGVLAGWLGQPYIHGNNDAIGVIVNVFSILAGFLVTLMTLLGDPGMYRGRTWRSDAAKKSSVYRRLIRHKWLFILYLSVLGLIFITTLIFKSAPDSSFVLWMERVYIGLAAVAFLLSLALPQRLMNLQLAKYEELIEIRRNSREASSNTE